MQSHASHDRLAASNSAYSSAKLKARFLRLWFRRLRPGAEPSAAPVWEELIQRYSEEHRRYHTVRHLAHCLRQLDSAYSLAEDADAVEMAIWFHDVVYAPDGTDNEQRSAAVFERAAGGKLDPSFITTVTRLILATTHRGAPPGRDEAFIRDIDLAAMGSPWQRFLSDNRSLRAEQAQARDELYYSRKLAFLRGLLARRSIYFTAFFQARFESAAQKNIERYIARLGADGGGSSPP